jgi:hypothetical protein
VLEDLRREWAKGEELAAVRIVEPLRRNMDRAREILEVRQTIETIVAHCRIFRKVLLRVEFELRSEQYGYKVANFLRIFIFPANWRGEFDASSATLVLQEDN